jgi:hypothetical protein
VRGRAITYSVVGSIEFPRPVTYDSNGLLVLVDHGFTGDEICTMITLIPKKLIRYEE